MLLNAIDTGPPIDTGAPINTATPNRTALLLHGLMGSAESWWRVIPLLERRGYRVIALDLPGHGLSPRDPDLTIERAAASVVETVRHRVAGHAEIHAIGHSYGATVLAAASGRLRPATAVHVDAIPRITGGQDRRALTERYEQDRRNRTDPDWLRATRPYYSATDAAVEARAAERFDPATSASLSAGAGGEWPMRPGSILILPDPSGRVADADARNAARGGVDVRTVPGAAHTVWYSHFEEFTASVPEMFGTR